MMLSFSGVRNEWLCDLSIDFKVDFFVFSSGSTGVEYAVDVSEKSPAIANAVSIIPKLVQHWIFSIWYWTTLRE